MNLVEFIQDLTAKNVELWVDGDKLRYRAPQDVLTPAILTEIKQYKLEIIQLLQKRAEIAKTYPLSHGQWAFWMFDQLAPDSPGDNLAYAAHLHPDLEIPALQQAFETLIERHSVLRTTYTEHGDKPVQQIHEHHKVPFRVQEAFNWSEDDFNNWFVQEVDRPFDLERGPALRVNLLIQYFVTDNLSKKKPILLVTIHHIAVDFWSLEIIINELSVLYEAIKTGTQASLPPQSLQYINYAQWEAQMLAGAEGERLWNYWHKQLAGDLPVLNLPTDRPRPPVQTYNGASYSFELGEKLTNKLKKLTKSNGVTLYIILLAAFQVFLFRYTNTEDILIGTAMAGRSLAEFESIVGYFVNLVVLRADLSENPTFGELLYRVRHNVLGALEHQDYPFSLLVERLQPPRDPSRSPLHQVTFLMEQSRRRQELEISLDSKLIVESFTPESRGFGLDLGLMIFNVDEVLKCVWQYNPDLFDPSTINRMAGHFQTLLEGIVANPNQRLWDLPILTVAERHQLLVEWNDTQTEYPQDKCIHQLFEEQVERTKEDAVAVVFEEQLTYQQLNCRANKLAHYLKTLGVGPDVLVGIFVERSLEMVVGLLGILKAGGAYLPLDPRLPQERLAFMLDNSQVLVLLTEEKLVARLPEHRAHVVNLDTLDLTHTSEENLHGSVTSENLAYVIYTSGSTGKPKGVQICHQSVVNFLNSMSKAPKLTEQDILLAVTTITFDIAGLELFLPLIVGAKVVLVSREVASDGARLLEKLIHSNATVMQATPATWRLLLGAGWQNSKQLKILCGGEALPWELASQLLEKGACVWNLYGPTETTIWSAVYEVEANHLVARTKDASVPIGRPIANTQLYILDAHLQPVPIGVPGELHIGGAGLARNYLNRPDLTQEKFIPNPFSDQPGARLYKTGDLAHYLSDGNIEFLGRIDNQVKIRGFRIELAEIESVLGQHPAIQETIVLAREDIPGDPRLVAYVVSNQESAPTNSELRRFLKQQLPEYMVPSAFVLLDTLPLTPNGKVDRRALPAPSGRPEQELSFVAPRTPIEEMLAAIWAEVLAIELVGVHDNFFELGGHSLLATQLISRVRTTSAVELPLRSLFEHPTVAGLAECIQTELRQGQQLLAPPPKAMPRDSKLPLSFAQARLWFLDQLEPGSIFYNMPGAVLLNGELNIAALEQSINEIIQRHEALRTNFISQDGQSVQVIHSAMCLTLPIVDLRSLKESEREIEIQRLATQEVQRPFNLANEPLVRVSLLVLSETEHVLLLKTHHIIFDGWSMGVFTRELAALYSAFCTGQPSPLAELPIQYADFAVWQRSWLQGSVLEAHLSYWKQQLSGAPTVLSLPTDRPRPAVQTYRGAHEYLALSVELSEALSKISRRSGVTLFMTLLAAFGTLLYRYTGQSDILIGSPIANRNHAQIEGLIGFFVNTLVLRTDLSGNPSFQELLARVREVALSAYAHQDVPFEELIEALQLPRDLSHTPLFQVMFILQNTPSLAVEIPSLTASPLAVKNKTAKFDLTLSLENTAQGLQGVLEYNTDLFDAATIARMAEHFQILLENIVANPEQRLWDLPLLTAAQRHQLLVDWNQTATEEPPEASICQLFEASVERTPDAVAVVFSEQQLTYRELNSRANQLAHYLRTLGVGPDVLVGLSVERSTEMVIGLLGILKAGGAYVPLDPNYPSDRLSYMVSDAQVSVLLTQNQLVFEWEHQATVICLDSDWQEIAFYSQSNLAQLATCEDLAYVIYTSGSTGKPKGVMISNGALANFTQMAISEYGISTSDSVLQFASISFDAAVEEIYPCLCAGGTLVLRTKAMLSDLQTLMQNSQQLQLTVLNLPTAYWHQLTMELESADIILPESLRLVIIGGERALPQQVRSWRSYFEQLPLINTYGPTEATVTATLYRVPSTWTTVECEVPIGRPLPLVQTYILDPHLQPVPIGVPGELHIGGAGLARGYLNRPDLTQAKFIPNPFSDEPGARLYKTGDLARYLSDGNIEFLGRIDNQVKIRGFRIELPEIESVLGQHPAIKETIVLARSDVPGNPRLVAYFVSNQEPAPTKSDLRQFLKQQLPEYMVPSAFVLLHSLPLTPNGKVDRRALPAPERAISEAQNAFVAPRDTLELQLAQTWEKILDVSPIGVTDDFFDLGGHSFLAVRLTSEIQKQFGQSLSLTTLFQKATIEQLASILRQQQDFTSWSSLVEIQPNGSKRPFFCVHPVGGNVLSYLDLARHLDPDQPFYGLQAKGLDGQHDPYTRVEDMAADYIEALRTVQPQGPYLLGGWSMGGVVAFEMAQQLQRQGHEVARVILLDSRVYKYTDINSLGDFDETALLNYFAKDLGESFGKNLTVSYAALQHLTLDEQLNYILEQAKMAAIIPSDVGVSQIRPLIKVFKANLQALQSYVPQVYPNRITLFRASEVFSEDLSDSALGWNELSVEAVDIYTIPGNHYTMLTKPYVQNLSVQLKHYLDEAQATIESSDSTSGRYCHL